MKQNFFLQEYIKITQYLYQLKSTLNFLLALLESWKSNRISEESIANIIRSDRNLGPTFVDQHLLLDMNFNEHCLIKNNISNKKVINLYASYTPGL